MALRQLLKKPALAGFFVTKDKLSPLMNCAKSTLKSVCLAALVSTLAGAAGAVPRCEVGGKSVSPYNGNTTAGVTGLMRCKEESTGLLTSEQELRGGVFVGLQRLYDAKGNLQRERTINERGNTDGVEKEFWPNGQLRSQSSQANGRPRGAAKAFYDNGKMERASFTLDGQVLVALAWDKAGHLIDALCSQTSVLAEDRKLCGFDGKVQTALFQNGTRRELRTLEQGKIIEATTFRTGLGAQTASEPSTVWAELAFQNGQRWHRVYNTEGAANGKNVLREERLYEPGRNAAGNEYRVTSSEGRLQWSKAWGANEQLIEQIRYANGRPIETERWYLNGAMKEKISITHDSGGNKSVRESYDDAGRLTARERLLTVGGNREQLLGVQQSFHSNGKPAQEDTYSALDERGRTRLVARKQWDESGALLADDEVLEDGSRKRR